MKNPFSNLGADSHEILSECSEKERMNSARIGATMLLPFFLWALGAGATAWMIGGGTVAITVSGLAAGLLIFIADSGIIAKASSGKSSVLGIAGRGSLAVVGSFIFAHAGIFPLARGLIDQEVERTKLTEIEAAKEKILPQMKAVQERLIKQTATYHQQLADAQTALVSKNAELAGLRTELNRWRAEADAEGNGKRNGKEGFGERWKRLMADQVMPLEAREKIMQAEQEAAAKAVNAAQEQVLAADKAAADDPGLVHLQKQLEEATGAVRAQKHLDPLSCYKALHRVMHREWEAGDYTLTFMYVCLCFLLLGFELLPLGLKLNSKGEHSLKVRRLHFKAEQDYANYIQAYPAVGMQLMQVRLRHEAHREELKMEHDQIMEEIRAARHLARSIMLEKAEVFGMAEDMLARVPKKAREEHKEFAQLLAKQLIENFLRSVEAAMRRSHKNQRMTPDFGADPNAAASA